jgi:hypothetical protein
MKTKYKDRIRELYDDNPDLRGLLAEKFPEIVRDEIPYATKGTIFMKHSYTSNLYMVAYKSGKFFIRNCTDDSIWRHEISPSNDSEDSGYPYLNKYDFECLLKMSMCGHGSITILDKTDLHQIHNKYVRCRS